VIDADDSIKWKFKHLKKKGVDDPNVDMFVAVFDNDTELLKGALAAGADRTVTDNQVLNGYQAELADFKLEEWSSSD
jgi:hypothetical protein